MKKSNSKKTILLLTLLVIALLTIYNFQLASHLILAHVFVIIPNNFRVKKEDDLIFRLFVAYGFNIVAEKPLDKLITKRFELITEDKTKNLLESLQQEERYPLLKTKVDFNGQGLLHLERDFTTIAIENNHFKEYLNSENIEGIKIDETKAIQTERYTRFIKALIQSDAATDDNLYKKVIGYKYEIVLLNNPYTLQKNDWLHAKILYNGKPLENKIITARNRYKGDSATYQYSKTDAQGVCSFKIERLGEWFIETTHMIGLEANQETDWESYWACYSFGI